MTKENVIILKGERYDYRKPNIYVLNLKEIYGFRYYQYSNEEYFLCIFYKDNNSFSEIITSIDEIEKLTKKYCELLNEEQTKWQKNQKV